jgi:hypothetical protein
MHRNDYPLKCDCGKKMKQITKHEYVFDCDCVKKISELKNIRMTVLEETGELIENELH